MSEYLPPTEYSERFWDRMKRAMGMSFYKYGPVADAYPTKVDAINSLQLRLDKYRETGNADFLVDVANFAMIEFMHPKHPVAHDRQMDSGESPGRVWGSGAVSDAANTHSREHVRKPLYARDGD